MANVELGAKPLNLDEDAQRWVLSTLDALLTRGRIFLDWARFGGDCIAAMQRPWHDIPTVMISFGCPYYLYDAPRVPTYINAYSTLDEMQAAVVDLLLGKHPWNRHHLVDSFCGLEDARW